MPYSKLTHCEHICRDGYEWWYGACELVQSQLSKVSTIDFPCFIQKRAIVIQLTINGKGDILRPDLYGANACKGEGGVLGWSMHT